MNVPSICLYSEYYRHYACSLVNDADDDDADDADDDADDDDADDDDDDDADVDYDTMACVGIE